jgi:hypothetical protein
MEQGELGRIALLMEHASWSMHIPRPMFFVRWSGII